MAKFRLGKTELMVEKQGFGCLPIQRCTRQEAAALLRRAVDGGINYFDTARSYTDSEEKMGYALKGVRDKIWLATKSHAQTGQALMADLETSLRALQTDSGLYATLQFPFSYLSGPQEQELVEKCRRADMGFIAMKGMAGGLIRDGYAASAFMETKPGVLPIWGVQHDWELEQFLDCVQRPAAMTEERRAAIDHDRKELTGNFCRGCGYCMPCPMGIEINNCARMSLMLRRAPTQGWLSPQWQEKMERIRQCLHCGHCSSRCPYGLDTPKLLWDNYVDYQTFLK